MEMTESTGENRELDFLFHVYIIYVCIFFNTFIACGRGNTLFWVKLMEEGKL